MRIQTAGFIVVAAALALGCGQGDKETKAAPADETAAAEKESEPRTYTAEEITAATLNGLKKKGINPGGGQRRRDKSRSGRRRWREAAAYVDGEAVGVFWHAELPAKLEPVWIEKESQPAFGPDQKYKEHTIKTVKVRRYRLSDYFEAVGVDLDEIEEIHVYGPHSSILALTGEEFAKTADDFYFRFGLGDSGKPIPVVPKDVGGNFDRLKGVAVYVDKKPPKVTEHGAVLNEKLYHNEIPYYGKPLRGGIRVYKDDRLAAVMKRKQLEKHPVAQETAAGSPRFDLFELLEAEGVKTDDIVQLEVIHHELRTQRFNQDELADMTLQLSDEDRGGLVLSDGTKAHAFAFYTEPLPRRTASNASHEPPR